MNETIKQLQNRRSVRNFTGERISDEDLELILRTAQRAPSSVNGQQVSLLVTRDKQKLKKLSELCNQEHIATADVFVVVVMDYYRGQYTSKTVGQKNIAAHSADGIFVGAIDGGILLNALQTAAEALGYGTTAIGAIRGQLQEIIDMFELPKGVFPLVGTTIGVPTDYRHKTVKPRVPFESFAFFDKYDAKKVEEGVEIHEKEMIKWREEEGTAQLPSYKEMIVRAYENLRYNKVNETLKKQGFEFTDNPKND